MNKTKRLTQKRTISTLVILALSTTNCFRNQAPIIDEVGHRNRLEENRIRLNCRDTFSRVSGQQIYRCIRLGNRFYGLGQNTLYGINIMDIGELLSQTRIRAELLDGLITWSANENEVLILARIPDASHPIIMCRFFPFRNRSPEEYEFRYIIEGPGQVHVKYTETDRIEITPVSRRDGSIGRVLIEFRENGLNPNFEFIQ
ncbi:MAG: hypothetical protein ACP5N9_01945 [Candidatus Bilamarchaeum sp.]